MGSTIMPFSSPNSCPCYLIVSYFRQSLIMLTYASKSIDKYHTSAILSFLDEAFKEDIVHYLHWSLILYFGPVWMVYLGLFWPFQIVKMSRMDKAKNRHYFIHFIHFHFINFHSSISSIFIHPFHQFPFHFIHLKWSQMDHPNVEFQHILTIDITS